MVRAGMTHRSLALTRMRVAKASMTDHSLNYEDAEEV